MPASLSDFPDHDTTTFPHQGIDATGFPDQHENAFPSRQVAASAVKALKDEIVPDINLPEAMKSAAERVGQNPAVQKLGSAAEHAMGTIGARPEMQPFNSLKPDIPKGSPLEQVTGSMKEVAEFPMRLSATLQEPQVMMQNATKEQLIKKGVNPYLATFGGMAAGVLADPINMMAAAEVGAAGISGFSKSRQALKMAMLEEDGMRAKSIAQNMTGTPPPTPPPAATKLPVMKHGATTGDVHALFAYNENFGAGFPPESKYQVWGDKNNPVFTSKKLVHGSQATFDQLKEAGVPIVGRTERSVGQWEPLDPIGEGAPRPGAPASGSAPTARPEPVATGYMPTESMVSEETADMPRPESDTWIEAKPTTKLDAWRNSAVNELGDLHTSMDFAAPSEDAHKDLMSTVRRYVGHEELARFDASKMVNEVAEHIPDAERRNLVTLYSQLGRSPTTEEINSLRAATEGAKEPGVKAINKAMTSLLDQNLSLSPQEAAVLKSYNGYFDQIGTKAQRMGLLRNLRESYGGPHLYMPKEEAAQGFIKRIVTGRSRFAQRRTFDNVFEAIKEGHVPKTLDSAELMGIYHRNISKAAAEKFLMGSMEKQHLINFTGDGRQIKSFQPHMERIEGEVYARQPYSDIPEVQKVMSRIAEDPVLDTTVIRALEKVNAWQKSAVLYMQIFHPKALAAEAIAKGFSPARFKDGLDMIEKNPEYVRSMIRSGLVVNDAKDIGKQIASHVTTGKNYANPLSFVKKINDIYSDAIFGKYMTGLKVYSSNHMIKRLVNMGVPQERAIQLAVEDSNRVFGGLNLRLMNRSPNMQRLFHLVSFAPDWTESKLRQMGAPLGLGLGDVTAQEAKMLSSQSRQYWVNLTALATATHLLNMVNPANKVLSVDLSQESGFKDVKKLMMLATANPVYFTSKSSALIKDLVTLMDPFSGMQQKMKKIAKDTMPINVKEMLK